MSNRKLYGFGILTEYDNKTTGIQGAGELSPEGYTYSGIEQQTFTGAFSSCRYAHLAGRNGDVMITPTNSVINVLLTIIDKFSAFNDTDTVADQVNQALTNYSPTNLVIGDTVNTGNRVLPDIINFTIQDPDDVANGDIDIELYFTNQALKENWPFTEHYVCPPLSDVGLLQSGVGSTVAANLQQYNPDEHTNRYYTNRPSPETRLIEVKLLLKNLTSSPVEYFDVVFKVGCYGPKASQKDLIYRAILDYLVLNGSISSNEWVDRFTELDDINTFFVLPLWDTVSVQAPPSNSSSTAYHSLIDYSTVYSRLRDLDDFDSSIIANRTALTTFNYKGIALIVMGAPANSEGFYKLNEAYPDYVIKIISGNNQFNKISTKTKNMIVTLEALLTNAEVYSETVTLPVGFERIEYNGKEFISGIVDNVNFYVMTKRQLING